MGLPVVYRLVASREMIDAAHGYEYLRSGLGTAFLEEVARLERHIAEAPGLYQIVDGSVRRAVMRRFPFGLFYLDEVERILVVGCFDLRRNPQTIGDAIRRR